MTLHDDVQAPAFEPAPPTSSKPRPFYWSVRREIWENRSLQVAPLSVAALVMVGLMLSTIGMPERRRGVLALDPIRQAAVVSEPYHFAAAAIIVTMVLVAATYCLGALHGERRDRSILFWKSLPVSDLTTVSAKAAIPFLVLPSLAAGVIVVLQLAMLAWSAVVLLASGVNPITPFPLLSSTIVLIYGLVTLTLWYAPVYGWLLLVSAWARRAPFLWAALPPAALCLLEKLAFNTTYLVRLVGDRLSGGYAHAFVGHSHGDGAPRVPMIGLSQIDPGKFLSSPGLWIGLALAAACLAGAVWLRRRHEPI